MMAPIQLTLLYGSLNVGRIEDAFCSDDTWYGRFEATIKSSDGPLAERLLEFICFCEEWHQRLAAPSTDPCEFDHYSDVIKSGLWETQAETGENWQIAEAPLFLLGGDVTWRTDARDFRRLSRILPKSAGS
jgi:hypothetical protein